MKTPACSRYHGNPRKPTQDITSVSPAAPPADSWGHSDGYKARLAVLHRLSHSITIWPKRQLLDPSYVV